MNKFENVDVLASLQQIMDNDASLPSTPLIVIVSPKAITSGSVSISAISDARSYWAFAHA